MPPLKNKVSVFRCKLLCLGQLPHFEPLGLAQFHSLLHLENGLTSAIPHMNMDGPMFVAVEEEPIAVFLENLRPAATLPKP